MVAVSCVGKLHAFALSEQLEKNELLDKLYTTYAYQKNTLLRRFVGRVDKEQIPVNKIRTNLLLAFPAKLLPAKAPMWNEYYDRWVAGCIQKSKAKVFIGWSGMSLHAIKVAKAKGMVTILERGSTHIVYQDTSLQQEYKQFGIFFQVHPSVIEKELKEYELADYISIPGSFVKQTFIEKGVDEKKLVVNPYGASSFFKNVDRKKPGGGDKFIVVYLGTLSIRKGLAYLFQAIEQLAIPADKIEFWFIGSVSPELNETVEKYKKSNWRFFGHVDHYELSTLLVQCDVGVQCSLEEGLSMVIPQMMSCGVPVIITPNSGGGDIVEHGKSGFVIPIRSPESITEKITMLYKNPVLLNELKTNAANTIKQGFTWDDYGKRYADFIKSIV